MKQPKKIVNLPTLLDFDVLSELLKDYNFKETTNLHTGHKFITINGKDYEEIKRILKKKRDAA